MYKLSVIGLGYIGLPTALSFAANGIQVLGVDYNKQVIEQLNNHILTFKEKGLESLFQKAIANGIKFSDKYEEAEVYIIAVPTPYLNINKRVDPQFLVSAVDSILKVAPKGATLVIESTISPGTIDRFVRPAVAKAKHICGESVHLVHAPERILPGNMIFELEHNSRTIGADDREVGERIKSLYTAFCKAEIYITDIRTAEMTKVVENTYRDINIAFANELAKICRYDNLNVYEIINIANKHPRVNILQPGPGVGGHCISVDPWFLVGDYPGLANIILAARKINDSMPEFVMERIRSIMKDKGMNDLTRVGLYGLTYKENVDDIRESPTLQLLESMERHLASPLKTYDPYVKKNITANQYHNFDLFLEDIDLLVIMVAHDEIVNNLDKIQSKIILDTRNISSLQGTYKL